LINIRAYQKIPWSSNFKFQRRIKLIYPHLTCFQTCMPEGIFSQDPLWRLILALYKTVHSKVEHLHNCKKKKKTMKHGKHIKNITAYLRTRTNLYIMTRKCTFIATREIWFVNRTVINQLNSIYVRKFDLRSNLGNVFKA